MSWIALMMAAGLLAQASPAAVQYADPRPVFTNTVETTVLDNGLTVTSIPFNSPGIIAYYTVVRTGSRNEVEEGLSGFAHFFEHMMFRGTEKYPQEKYNATLKSLGADSNAFTTDDWTCYHMTIPASALAKAVELESDRFRNLRYDEADFQKEARAVLGEYNKNASSPFLMLNETMQDKAYSKHTYKHTTIGFLADVKSMPGQYTYSKTFFDRWYRPENCTVLVVGDVDHAELVKLARAAYGGWERGKSSVTIPEEPTQTEARTGEVKWPLPTLPIIYFGYHIPAADLSSPDTPALDALAQTVFGETSPLYKSLVLDEQKVVLLMADSEHKRDAGLFTVLARVRDPKDVAEVKARIESALAQSGKEPVPDRRLRQVKLHLRYEFANSLDSPNAVARAVGEAIAIAGRPDAINRLYEAYTKLTPDDLMKAASKFLVPTNQTVVSLRSEIAR